MRATGAHSVTPAVPAAPVPAPQGTGLRIRAMLGATQNMGGNSILLIISDPELAKRVEGMIREGQPGGECVRVEALFDGLRALQERAFSTVVADLFLPDGQGLATLRHLQQHAVSTPVIAMCHSRDRDTGISAVRKGAHDFFCYEDMETTGFLRSLQGAQGAERNGESKSGAERRINARFPCRLAVSYQTLEHPFMSGQGTSETLNISSKGLLFATEAKLEAGQLVQVTLDWPARLENQVPLKLVAEGRVVRNIDGQAAVTIEKYEFRTRRGPIKQSVT